MVDPSLGHRPFAETEAVGQAVKYLDFGIRAVFRMRRTRSSMVR